MLVANLLNDLEKLTFLLCVFSSITPTVKDFSLMNKDNAYEQL